MPARKFAIQGRVVDRETEDGIPNLTITATAINVRTIDDVFARATTDEQGNFTMKFTDLDLQAYAGQIPSPLFFNIYQGDFLLEDTRSTRTWSLSADGVNPITRLTIEIARTQETFIVRGHIVTSDGSPPTQRLTVRASNQGIGRTTVLASERIQTDGSYEIEYSRNQLEPGQERANLVVEVFGVLISRPPRPLVTSPLILNADPEETINLALPDPDQDFRGLSLYAELRSQLSPHIPADSLNTLTDRDIILLAQKAQMTEQQASYLIQAFRLSEHTSLDPAIWFALFSQGSSLDLAILLAEGETIHRTQLSDAIAANIIGQSYEPQIDDIIARLQALAIEETLADREEPTDQPSIRAVLNRTRLSSEQKQTFLRTWTAQKSSPQEFWTTLRQSNDFQNEEVSEIQRVTQLNILSLGHTRMADSLLQNGVRDAKQVATLEVDNLLDLMTNVDPPEEVEGVSIAERKRNYAGKMLELAIQSFPTTRLLHKWTTDPEVNTEDIATFSRNNGEFEFKTTNVRKYLRDNPQALEGVRDREALTAQLEGISRLFSLIPQDDKFNALRTLWRSDVPNSAFGIVRLGESAFVRQFEGELQAEQAKEIYAYAKHKAAVTTATLMRYSQVFNPIQMYALNWTGPKQLPDDIPDWGTLFGSLDFCECQHCRSIQSPAAYLVDLLQFLDQANAGNRSGLDQLLRQRPDLAHIQLDCANTNTAMPYIDLVNEVLENAVVNGLTLSIADTPQTTLTTEELRANPEHIRPEAYDGVLALLSENPTWSLPFDLSHEERQIYLNHLGISVSQLMDTFHRPGEAPEAIDRAMAALGMTLIERRIITGETGEHGLGTSNAILPMLKRSQLDYDTLNDLLISRFFNPTHKAIEFEGDSCALEDATLDLTTDERDRLHRFTRLYRLIGWSITDLDQAIVVIGDRTINNAFLIQLAYLKQLKERFKLPISELLSWWANIPTHSSGDEKSWYERLFLNPAVNDLKERDPQNPNRINQLFALNTNRTEIRRPNERQFFLTEEELEPEITPLILAAINISADELRLLIQETLPDDNINLANLSHLYRVASFSRALRISIQDYLVLARLTGQQGLTHFNLSDATSQPATPEITWNFIQQFDSLTASGFKIQELDYLLVHRFLPTFPLPFTNEAIAITLAELQTELRKIRLSQPLASLQPAELKELLAEKLPLIVEDTETAIAIIEGTSDPDFDLTDEAQQTYLEENFSSFLDIPLAIQNLVQDGLTESSARILFVLQPLLNFLSQNVVIQQLTSAIGLETEVCEALLKRHLSHPQDTNQRAIAVFLDEAFIYSNLNTAEAIAAVLNAAPMPADVDPVDVLRLQNTRAIFYRLAKLFRIFKQLTIPTSELDFVFTLGNSIGWYDLANIPIASIEQAESPNLIAWLRLSDSYRLNRQIFTGTFSVVQLLNLIHNGAIDRESMLAMLSEQTGWNIVALRFLTGDRGYNFSFPQDFQDERWLERLQQAFHLIQKSGVTASQIWRWNTPNANSDLAQQIRNAAKARYDVQQWLEIAPELSDRLRIKRRNALRDYLIATHSEFRDADDLYAHFLIDSEMAPCFMTSRIRQAISSVQLFVHRVFLGLEPNVHFDRDEAEQWAWRKNYRVWEANRKVFLYPENYAEPELRDDKTPFFEELREALLQEEVTADAVERAYLTYLRRLDEVARLEISGLYVEDEVVHIFARTRGVPPIYYYRRWVDQSYFTAWEKVDITIEGNHLLPVVYNRRLWLLWPTFTEKAVTPSSSQLESSPPNSPEKYWEIKLSWSELRNGKWSTPKTSEGYISTNTRSMSKGFERGDQKRYYFWAKVSSTGRLEIFPFFHYPIGRVYEVVRLPGMIRRIRINNPFDVNQPNQFFRFEGCNSSPVIIRDTYSSPESGVHIRKAIPYRVPNSSFRSYMKFEQATKMTMFSYIEVDADGKIISKNSKIEKILSKAPSSFYTTPPHQHLHFHSQSPFFYEDAERTFFVIPETVYKSNSGSRDSRTYRSLENSQLDLGALAGIRAEQFIVNRSVDVVPERTTRLATPRRSDRIFTATDQNTVINRTNRIATELDEETDQLASEMSTLAIIPSALTGVTPTNERRDVDIVTNGTPLKIYNFRTFYHPYTCLFIEQVNRFGIEGLLKPNPKGKGLVELHRQLTPNSPFKFSAIYGPQSPLPLNSPIENIDFTYKGAYSQYNWELFFHIPMLIANQLSQNQRFAEAQRWYHYIFDPTETDDEGLDTDERQRRFWKLKPFYQFSGAATIQEIVRLINQGDPEYEEQIEQWEENPFNPHLIARLRTVAYMQLVVMKYLDNLIAWGDNLFKQDTIESINEATQLYILAAQLLGRKPEQVKARNVEARSFAELRSLLDELSNAQVSDANQRLSPLIALENQMKVALKPKAVFQAELLKSRIGNNVTLETSEKELVALQPANAIVALANTMTFVSRTPTPDRPTPTLYFCILPNDKLLGYWDTVGDRLFKIRNCMNIEGVTRSLALFEPPIDPALLVKAVAAGIDLSSALSDLNAPLPHYRFSYMLPRALELCNEVKSLGNSLLSAIEKRDAEELSLIRAGHEVEVLQSIQQMKQKAIEEANESVISLEKSRDLADIRHQYYSSREYTNQQEQTYTSELELARGLQEGAELLNIASSIAYLFPDLKFGVQGISSPELTFQFGGTFIGNMYRAESAVLSYLASKHSHAATMASIEAGYQRRAEDWEHQAALALKEIEQVGQQILAARVRIEIAEKDLESHIVQIQNSQEVFQFMKDKYTTQQLYSWMITQISTLYFQSYQMAYDLAKRAEQCFRYELEIENSNFIQFGYWDSLKKGLLSGDRLYKDLKRMEIAYLEQNRRNYEMTKHISLALLNPFALLQLRETGVCEVNIPETLFDLDGPGHYLRRIQSVSLTIPCVTGPYVSVNCTLTLLKNSIRTSSIVSGNASLERANNYPRQEEDLRFRDNIGAIQSIVTSNAQNDSGLFEVNFRDERYLPFEGAGAISRWRFELPWRLVNGRPQGFQQFDYQTISDVILHIRYTAREGGSVLREAATRTVQNMIETTATEIPLMRMFSAKHEFPGEWYQFLHPAAERSPHMLELTLNKERFPFLFQRKTITINSIELHLKLKEGIESRPDNVTLAPPDSQPVDVNNFTPTPPDRPLPWAPVNLSSEVNDSSIWTLTASEVNPDELEDIFVVCQYSVSN
ncbi:neuraminidase-like domain-containing protein [Pantanalinema rosaneae CENA516]|uniref:Tc toxin subunit A-related protein n=1 Tax=Pantanalinema rosaneae TaxID=1620701 RepID=UPI003D6DCB17